MPHRVHGEEVVEALIGYLAYLRRQVRIEEEVRERRAARMAGSRGWDPAEVAFEELGFATAIENCMAVWKRRYGFEVMASIERIDLPPDVSQSVYERMETSRERVARQLRAEGQEQAERIRADAERQRTVLLANGYREAEELRGQGDAAAAQIYARAFGRNAEFFGFWRSLQAYRETIGRGNDLLLIEPDSEFFRYLKDPSRR
jgi:regulator of protease activity HflC (stomatin/prohibitin superfamily)